MRIFIHLFFLVVFSSVSVFAQEKSSSFYVTGGVQLMNLENINQRLSSASLPEINESQFYYGFGGNTRLGKIMFGGEGCLFYSNTEAISNTALVSTGGMGYLYLGYAFVEKEKLYLIPRIGIGGGGMDVQINSTTSSSLEDFLLSNSSRNLTIGNLLIHSGLKLGFVLDTNTDFYFDLGYNLAFENDWKGASAELTESVSDPIGGLFWQVSVAYKFE